MSESPSPSESGGLPPYTNHWGAGLVFMVGLALVGAAIALGD